MSSRRLQDVFAKRLQDVLEDEKLLRWRRVEDVFKTCLEDVLKTNRCLLGFWYWKSLVPFCLWKKRPENAFLKPTVRCRQIIQKCNLCYPIQQQIGYLIIYNNVILSVVLIKIWRFSIKSHIIRVYCILKNEKGWNKNKVK